MGPVLRTVLRSKLERSRRFLVVLLLAGSAVFLTELPAHACSCVQQGVKNEAAAADAVFRGVVTKVGDGSHGGQVRSYAVSVDRVYSGSLVTDSVRVSSATQASACGLDLKADKRYIFFARAKGSLLKVNSCGGTAPAGKALTAKVVKLLGDGKQPQQPPPSQATFTRVDGADPTPLSRLMAPGGALLLISLLGLAVVRRMVRRSA